MANLYTTFTIGIFTTMPQFGTTPLTFTVQILFFFNIKTLFADMILEIFEIILILLCVVSNATLAIVCAHQIQSIPCLEQIPNHYLAFCSQGAGKPMLSSIIYAYIYIYDT